MSVEDRFDEHYKQGSAPWDIGKPDFNLIQIVSTTPIAPCKALDIGCGTGDNAIWLSQKIFEVFGVDNSEIAIEKARENAANANVSCTFAMLNFLKSTLRERRLALLLIEAASIRWILPVNGRALPNRSTDIWKRTDYGSV